jgi:hypothetical protein
MLTSKIFIDIKYSLIKPKVTNIFLKYSILKYTNFFAKIDEQLISYHYSLQYLSQSFLNQYFTNNRPNLSEIQKLHDVLEKWFDCKY